MSKILLAAAATVALASAQTTTKIFFPIADDQILVASEVGSGSNGVKTLAIACPLNVASESCGIVDVLTVTAGPSTFAMDDNVAGKINCELSGTTYASCIASSPEYDTNQFVSIAATATATDFDLSSLSLTPTGYSAISTVISDSDLADYFIDVTITAGANGAASTGSSSGSAARSSASGSSSGTATGSASGASASSNAAPGSYSSVIISGAAVGILALPMLLL